MVPQVRSRLDDLSAGKGVRKTEQLNSMVWRWRLWESSMDSIKRRPILGYGLGSFEGLSANFFDLEKGKGAPAHNIYVELLFETGLVGLIAHLAIYFVVLKLFFLRIWNKVKERSVEATMMFAYVIGYAVVGVSDNTLYYLAFNWYFWFFVGLILQSISLEEAHLKLKTAQA